MFKTIQTIPYIQLSCNNMSLREKKKKILFLGPAFQREMWYGYILHEFQANLTRFDKFINFINTRYHLLWMRLQPSAVQILNWSPS